MEPTLEASAVECQIPRVVAAMTVGAWIFFIAF